MDKVFHCPRCKNIKVIEYSNSIECPKCKLEFHKKDFSKFSDDQILSIQEKTDVLKFFKD